MSLGVPNQYNGLTSREGLYHALGQMFTAGVVSGFNVRQAASPGMRVLVGGESSSPDDALLFDESTGALYPLFQNKGGQAVTVNVNPASSSQKRITSIVAYCKVGAPTSQSSPDNQSTVGVIAVDGFPTSGKPQEPSESVIKAAITGQSAYVVLANISVKAGINRVLDADITNGVKRATLKTDKIDFASLLLSYKERTTQLHIYGTTPKPVPELASKVTIPNGVTKVKVQAYSPVLYNERNLAAAFISIWKGEVGTGTRIQEARSFQAGGSGTGSPTITRIVTVTPGEEVTFNVSMHSGEQSWVKSESTAQMPMYLLVEAVG